MIDFKFVCQRAFKIKMEEEEKIELPLIYPLELIWIHPVNSRQYTVYSIQQTVDIKHKTVDSREYTLDSRQQTVDR